MFATSVKKTFFDQQLFFVNCSFCYFMDFLKQLWNTDAEIWQQLQNGKKLNVDIPKIACMYSSSCFFLISLPNKQNEKKYYSQ
jgi:hypothetical protein